MKRLLLPLSSLLLLAGFARGQNATIQKAMRDELARNVKELKLDTIPGPYFFAYRIDDGKALSASAQFGALVYSNVSPFRNFRVWTRVGSPSFDNTNFFSWGENSGLRYSMGTAGTTLEDDYDAIRRDLWLTTDGAYKTSLQELSKKRAAFEHKTRSEDTIDFTPAPAFHLSEQPTPLAMDTARWQSLARKLSAVLGAMRDIQSCNATVNVSDAESYYLTSEGTDVAEPGTTVRLEVSASTQAADGMPLSDALLWVELQPDYLPNDDSLLRAVRTMGERLLAQRTSQTIDEYTGPVLIEGEAAGEVFGQIFSDAMCALRRPDVDNPQMKMALGMLAKESPYQSRIGSRILPDGFTVDDLPDRDTLFGVHSVGGQTDDDEGVASPPVHLVERGVLKTLLTCRTPHKKLTVSNGRGFSIPARPAITNLVFIDAKGVSDADLKAKLIEQCQVRSLPYGLRVARLSPVAARSGDQQDMMAMYINMMSGGDGEGEKVTRPTEVYKVFADGHEEQVRGLELAGIGTSAFKEILAAGSRTNVYNTIVNVKSASSPFQGGNTKSATIAAPNILFDELTTKKVSGPFKTLPVVEAP